MITPRQTVNLKYGTVTLQEWGDDVADAYLTDLMLVTSHLDPMRDDWAQHKRQDVTLTEVWHAFWRLVRASLLNTELPRRVTWADRLTLLNAMWELNDLEEAAKKWTASSGRMHRLLAREQADQTVRQILQVPQA